MESPKTSQNSLPVLFLIVGIILSFAIWQASLKNQHKERQIYFKNVAKQISNAVKERLELYIDAHYGGVGLFVASDRVTREEWKLYAEAIHLRTRYPGINGLGYAAYVQNQSKTSFEEFQALDDYPSFHIKPAGNRNDYMPVTFIEPLSLNATAVGYDMGSEANRREALERSRDEGRPYISAKIILVQDSKRTPGFLSYVPVYNGGISPRTTEARRKAFRGWIYAPFITNDFFKGLAELELKQIYDQVSIKVYNDKDLSQDQLIFDNKQIALDPEFESIQTINLYGQEWTFHIQATDKFTHQINNQTPLLVLIIGLILSLFLFTSTRNLSLTRAKAESLAEEMTKAIIEKSLELERSNKELEQFAYIASHDLQEPLRTINSFADLIRMDLEKRDLLHDKVEKYFKHINSGTERMRNLISDLLVFSKTGKDIVLNEIELQEPLQASLENLQMSIDEIQAQIEINTPLPTVLGDKNKLTQLFQNLISNAIKYKDKNKEQCHIKVYSEDHSQTHCKIIIEDNGTGIAEEYYDKVFEIFQRLETAKPGTGIGLAMCKKIIHYHTGEIWIDSKLGEYTRFCFTLLKAK